MEGIFLFLYLVKSDYIPLKLRTLNNSEIKREYCIKFLGVLLEECLTWKQYIEIIENKISKNIGILYKAKFFLNHSCLKKDLFFHFSFVHSYLNYANIVWSIQTYHTKPKTYYSKQKHITASKNMLQSPSEIIGTTAKNGIVQVSTSNVKLFLETIWSG